MTVIAAPSQPVRIIAGGTNGVNVKTGGTNGVNVTARTGPQGPQGPPGPPGGDAQWDAMTQAEYDALPAYDPNTLYVIVP